ncbi:MAG: rhomboid family intramembrane serine protease [Bacteroidia bacterium]|nr:MAG: rhomboid family intramembrane serine protease [Bacteroidia bacterium]
MNATRPAGMPPVTLNFLIINILMYLIKLLLYYKYDYDIVDYLGLRYYASSEFHWYQLITYMFVHGNEMHLFFNMFALWMFGPLLEDLWGSKKFIFYYLLCGLGAALTQYVFYYFSIREISENLSSIHKEIMEITDASYRNYLLEKWNDRMSELYDSMIVIGASGAIYGLLAAYGVLFPNTYFYIYFIMPMKAKWFVILYGLIELFTGIFMEDNVAHFAHLGGMAIGIIWVLIWKRKNKVYFFTEM